MIIGAATTSAAVNSATSTRAPIVFSGTTVVEDSIRWMEVMTQASPVLCAICNAFAKQAGRTEHKDANQYDERENVLVVAAEYSIREVADITGPQLFDQAEQHAAHHR